MKWNLLILTISLLAGLCLGQTQEPCQENPDTSNKAEPVAFSAATDMATIQVNQVVVYGKVFLNEGNGYNSTTGVFTAPKDGIYIFHFHLLTQLNRDAWTRLYKNEEAMVTAYGRQANDYASGGNSAAFKLKYGDKVTVRAMRAAYIYAVANTNEYYGTFTGFLYA